MFSAPKGARHSAPKRMIRLTLGFCVEIGVFRTEGSASFGAGSSTVVVIGVVVGADEVSILSHAYQGLVWPSS